MPLTTTLAGAFHTHHMESAVERLEGHARAIWTSDAQVPLISNRDGQVVTDGSDVLARLVSQVRNPVRWDLCMEQLLALGVTGLIELPPAGTLVGLAKRALRGVPTVAVKTPDDLAAAAALLTGEGA